MTEAEWLACTDPQARYAGCNVKRHQVGAARNQRGNHVAVSSCPPFRNVSEETKPALKTRRST
jgi:hypothetical protein